MYVSMNACIAKMDVNRANDEVRKLRTHLRGGAPVARALLCMAAFRSFCAWPICDVDPVGVGLTTPAAGEAPVTTFEARAAESSDAGTSRGGAV